jgi:hypothetical protein
VTIHRLVAGPCPHSLQQMALLANAISLTEPSKHFTIQFLARMDTKRMDVIAWRDRFDFRETRIFQAPGQHHMTGNSIAPQAHRCETHSHLKRDSRFFRHHAHRPAALYQLYKVPEQCAHLPA